MSILDPKQDAAAAIAVTDNATEDITGRIIPAFESMLDRQREKFFAALELRLDRILKVKTSVGFEEGK